MNEEKVPNKFSEIGWAYINGGGEFIRNPAIIIYGIINMVNHWLYHGSLTAGLFGGLTFSFSIFAAGGLLGLFNFLYPREEEETKENS